MGRLACLNTVPIAVVSLDIIDSSHDSSEADRRVDRLLRTDLLMFRCRPAVLHRLQACTLPNLRGPPW
jgi:hypothetical protein